MRKIIERLPSKLQSSWRDNADRILNADKREVCIEDIASFVEEKSRALSNPIFGKLPFSGTAEGEGLVGPRPYHFFAPPPPLFAPKRKIVKIKKKT